VDEFKVLVAGDHGAQNYECAVSIFALNTLHRIASLMSQKPRIVIIFTGGTIASKLDQAWGGVAPSLTGGEILSHIPDVADIADVVVHEYGTFPGPHITPQRMLEISLLARTYASQDDVDGIVITHGTDTLEETAYFLELTTKTAKPIVVIGAMRNSSEPDWDGPRNLRDALTVASHPLSHGLGVLVCLGGDILAASEASKTDTSDLETFASLNFGPLGRITNGHVLMHRNPLRREHFEVNTLPAFVPLLRSFAGMDATLIDASIEKGASGLVIEAFGVGNVTPPVFYALKNVIKQGYPVVLVSRCPVGRVEHLYAYEGAGRHLYDIGVIFADYLTGEKARIKLICAIAAGWNLDEIRTSFEWVEALEGLAK